MPSRTRLTRLLIVAPAERNVGGQAIQAQLLLRNLAHEKCLDVKFQPIDPEFPRLIGKLRRLRYLRTALNEFLYCVQLAAAISRCDVVHAFSASYFSFLLGPTPAILLARLMGRRVILNYHSGEADDHLARWPSAVWIAKRASRIVVPSDYLREVFARHALRAECIYNFIDLQSFRFRDRHDPQPNILVNRNLYGLYNVACALEAFARVQSRFPGASITVAGEGPQSGELQEKAAHLGLRNIRFLGRVAPSQMPSLYEANDFWLNASEIDNMPLSILEAYSSGTAVVSTRAGGIPLLVEDGLTGRLVPVGDAGGLASAIIDLVENPASFRALVQNARKQCESYAWPAVRDRWLSTYLGVAQAGHETQGTID